MIGDILFRCEGNRYSDGDCYLAFYDYAIVKETPCGVWIDLFGKKKFVLSGTRKRYAYPTKKEALESFIKRKSRQVRILAAQHDNAQALYEAGKAKLARADFENAHEPIFEAIDLFGDAA